MVYFINSFQAATPSLTSRRALFLSWSENSHDNVERSGTSKFRVLQAKALIVSCFALFASPRTLSYESGQRISVHLRTHLHFVCAGITRC